MGKTRVQVLSLVLLGLLKGGWSFQVTLSKDPVEVGDDVVFEVRSPDKPETGSWQFRNEQVVFWIGAKLVVGLKYNDRIDVNYETGSLKLMSVKLSDSGDYFVHLQKAGEPPFSLTGNATLHIIDSVTKVTVNSPSPYPILNNTFSLTCNVSGNADSRSWLKDGQPLSAGDRITFSKDNSAVSFNPVLVSDNGTYQCIANSYFRNGTSTGYNLVVNCKLNLVCVTDGPEQVSITGPDASRIGSTAVFTCSALSQPGCEYTWFINGKLVAKGSPYKIHPVNSSNDGSYTCTAWNSLTERNSSAVKMHHVLDSASLWPRHAVAMVIGTLVSAAVLV
ncbi:carcinoembryonic antigen-related cell adhesion molecule 5-like [Acipenser oxyrinchus oxyrinchus]|uniref:Carcinoembryonic antigen-related cell adhesion molecule 5-like n=1 Tax=Acipenser oxyrinchus oxyrinchus TaxID=40147 RepID=A0AAD8CHY8_ACIOX|nr:carcinoembryonic antigen-related cell adhesion molecule 5-like [Acipenser oxyrinchus oxyrinchus]